MSPQLPLRHFLPTVGKTFKQSCVLYQRRASCSAIDKVAENKISEWLHQGGADSLREKNQPLKRDCHKEVASALGVGPDYVHSKILADNNIRPDSIQRRLDMDREWEALQQEIQRDFRDFSSSSSLSRFSKADMDGYIQSKHAEEFRDRIQKLDQMAKRCNEAIISDSMRFNGRSPVRHARPFRFAERIREAILPVTTK